MANFVCFGVIVNGAVKYKASTSTFVACVKTYAHTECQSMSGACLNSWINPSMSFDVDNTVMITLGFKLLGSQDATV